MSRKSRKAPVPTAAAFDATAASGAAARVGGIDTLRGIALCLMFIYHFSFDLRFYGVTHADFEHDPFWLGFRAVIVTSFMALVGMSLVLADRAGATPAHFWRRVGVIAACALGVSAASAVIFPRSYIYFGILHCIAIASVLAWPAVRRPRAAFAIGIVIAGAGIAYSHPAFDEGLLSCLGFATRKPVTEDYVPLAPWAGAVFIGVALGHVLARNSFRALAPLAAAPAPLRWLGRHSLLVYMIHQPILLGVLWLVVRR
ncbi:MAG: heparan-alpha-glucosaminide N-acetyltransferase [Betaproteobacteria bacterium]